MTNRTSIERNCHLEVTHVNNSSTTHHNDRRYTRRFLAYLIDWCCSCYSLENSPVALLEVLFCSTLFRFEISVCCHVNFIYSHTNTLCVCVRALGLCFWHNPSSAPPNQAPVPGSRQSPCALIIHVCLCVCASTCACENVSFKWRI